MMHTSPPPYSQLINEEDPGERGAEIQLPQTLPPPPYSQSFPPSYEHTVGHETDNSRQGSPLHSSEDPFGSMVPQCPDIVVQRSVIVLVVNGARNPNDSERVSKSFCGHMVFACFVLWFCGIFGGLKAFILAVKARQLSREGHDNEASVYGQASIQRSIIGFFVGMICISIIIGIIFYVSRDQSVSELEWRTTTSASEYIGLHIKQNGCCLQEYNPCVYYEYLGNYYNCRL